MKQNYPYGMGRFFQFPEYRLLSRVLYKMIKACIPVVLLSCAFQDKSQQSMEELSFPLAVHPRYLEIPVPSAGIEVRTNPPVLRWPAEKGNNVEYVVRMSQDPEFANPSVRYDTTGMALLNPHMPLDPGKWFWQVKKAGGTFSPTNEFLVDDTTIPLVSPVAENFLKAVPAAHPRVLSLGGTLEKLKTLSVDPKAAGILKKADGYVTLPIPAEDDAVSKIKFDDPDRQRKINMDASQRLSSGIYEQIKTLSMAYLLTGNPVYGDRAVTLASTVATWDPKGVTHLSDFGDARCMAGMALVFDTFYDQLNTDQKNQLAGAIAARAGNFYREWLNDVEAKVLSGHVWQHILNYFFQSALALYGEHPDAGEWLAYAYELFFGRAPVLGGFDGGWIEGAHYFRMNMETMLEIPLFVKAYTGFDFIRAHPWYRENIKWMIWHIPPGSSSDGFGDNAEEVLSPGPEYILFADMIARLTGDSLASWYTRECRKYEPDISENHDFMRWLRLTLTDGMDFPEPSPDPDLPMGTVFRDVGLAALHSHAGKKDNNLSVVFKSSPFGAYGHLLCDQNTFNIVYEGERLFFRTGYKVTMDDPHRTGWYQATKSQNGILVNRNGQPYSNGAYGWISAFLTGEEAGYVKGIATPAYRMADKDISVNPEKVIRHIALLKPDLVIIYDDLESDQEVEWSWLIHGLHKTTLDPENSTFFLTHGETGGAGKLFCDQELEWAITDTFDVPAVNWRQSRSADGKLKEYDDSQWHLTATTRNKLKSTRFLSVIRVGSGITPGNVSLDAQTDEHGVIHVNAGKWQISATMDSNRQPGLFIASADGTSLLGSGSTEIFPDKLKRKKQGNSNVILLETVYGKERITEAPEEFPYMMRNVMMYQQTVDQGNNIETDTKGPENRINP